jgi:uncharacterized membrane protein
MIEPVKIADFFLTFFSAASVILFGALYALLFAYSRIKNVPRLMPLAYAAYAVLFAAVIVLASVANLFGSLFWVSVVALMLVGYLVVPHVIWNLCVATHAETLSAALDRSVTKTLHQSTFHKSSGEKTS